MPLLEVSLQKLFIWFVIGFPVLIVLLFFIVLIFRPFVLYSPSDYKNEENFVKLLILMDKALTRAIDIEPNLEKQLKPLISVVEESAHHITVNNKITQNYRSCPSKEINVAVLKNGDNEFKLWKKKTILGKGENADIVINDVAVSRIHYFIIRKDNNEYYIQDAYSSNGTVVNEYMAEGDSLVHLGQKSEIILGNTFLTFENYNQI
ncbi:MAG: FHA domain-containing protein [Ruminococcaceae bacterium]|nr:FHA domain-containing protein [Oscillospiraceae bacterium]